MRVAGEDNVVAMRSLGIINDRGQGVKRDSATARMWLEKAAARQDILAMRYLGNMAQNTRGEPPDYARALDWYQKAAALGDGGSMNNIWLSTNMAEQFAKDVAVARSLGTKGGGPQRSARHHEHRLDVRKWRRRRERLRDREAMVR